MITVSKTVTSSPQCWMCPPLNFYTLTVIAIAGFASIDPEIKKSATAPTTPGRTLLLPSNR